MKRRATAQILTGALVLTLFGPVLWWLAPQSDFAVHSAEAEYWATYGSTRIQLPNFLFAGLTVIFQMCIPGLGFLSAGVLVALLAQGLLAATLFECVLQSWPSGPTNAERLLLCALGAVSLMIVMPFNLLTFGQHNLYHGYIATSVYHSPSLALLKPLALLAWLQAIRIFEPGKAGLRSVAFAATVVGLGVLAKPNFAVALLPALVSFAGWRTLRHRPGDSVDWRRVWLGFVAPGCAVLAWQYLYTYSSNQAAHPSEMASGIVFAPLRIVSALSQASPAGLTMRFLLSILFPAAVYLAYTPQARRDVALNLAWVLFSAGAACSYLLAESGPRAADGNFLWSGQITLFILFATSATFALRHAVADRSPRRALCAFAYGLHLASGLVWYALQFLHRFVPSVPLLKEWF